MPCRGCRQSGHNIRTCARGSGSRRAYHCSVCGQAGHNKTSCPLARQQQQQQDAAAMIQCVAAMRQCHQQQEQREREQRQAQRDREQREREQRQLEDQASALRRQRQEEAERMALALQDQFASAPQQGDGELEFEMSTLTAEEIEEQCLLFEQFNNLAIASATPEEIEEQRVLLEQFRKVAIPAREEEIKPANENAEAVFKRLDSDDPSIPIPNIPFHLLSTWTDNFSEENKIGSGGFGDVYSCRVTGVDSLGLPKLADLAVKKLSDVTFDGIDIDDFLKDRVKCVKREVDTLQDFRHPHIVKLVGFSVPEGTLKREGGGGGGQEEEKKLLPNVCLVYELVENGDISVALRDNHRAREFSWEKRLKVMIDIASALNYLHCHFPGRPAYHRDVKSANITLTNAYRAKLIDCGLAKYIPQGNDNQSNNSFSFTKTHQRFGTGPYMCSSYNASGVYDAKSEIYSFGIVLAEIFTGMLHHVEDAGGAKLDITDWEDVADLEGDKRAGEWPSKLAKDLKVLIAECVKPVKRRRGKMSEVLMELTRFQRQYRKKEDLDAENKNEKILELQEKLASQKAAAILHQKNKTRECKICYCESSFEEGVDCPKEGKEHFICNDCFDSQVKEQIGDARHAEFIRAGCHIYCALCINPLGSVPFNDADVAKSCTASMWMKYKQAGTDVQVNQAIRNEEKKFKEKIVEMKREMGKMKKDSEDKEIKDHEITIYDEFLSFKCPSCKAPFLDFNGCFALQCSTCKNCCFCAWCFTVCNNSQETHRHVQSCPRSSRKGSYYGQWEDFLNQHKPKTVRDITDYLKSQVPPELREKVKAVIRDELMKRRAIQLD